jgi:hypothetical protein
MSEPSVVRVTNVWADYLMEWFYFTVTEPSGDGAAMICCGNPRETADYFVEWWKKKYLPQMKEAGYKKDEFFHEREETIGGHGELVVNFHDSNENFIFCDRVAYLPFGDISFVVEEDCLNYVGAFCIKKVNDETL